MVLTPNDLAAQPPPTKHLTDEELKQQYGIHMTSRIQADGDSKESNWADIDDDEDDWAPETIEWNDGTKISLTQTESLRLPGQSKAEKDKLRAQPTSSLDGKSPGRGDAKVLTSKPQSSLGPKATILKLGGNADKQQTRLGGDVLKGASEKDGGSQGQPALTKSPWAPLPPIEKVSPVPVSLPPQPLRPSRYFNDRGGQEPALPPTKEIAADDFNRSWRDTQSAAPRELFNSQSGRYEPVPEVRRGQPRNEAHFRPSSLLQRPNNEQPGPAEPSPAFQTNRSSISQETGSWGRRRASSNVSGGSGVMGRRLSMSKPDLSQRGHEYLSARRDSQQNERPPSPHRPYQQGPYVPRGHSPARQTAQAIPGPPPSSHAPPAIHSNIVQPSSVNAVQPSSPPMEDPIAMQQRIMREKRETARQRRLDEEAKEEAAKQERIRLKLAAMGPPPTEKHSSKDQAPTLESAKQPIIAPSPPKPPVPEPCGEPKQYGMMKVHPPEPVKKSVTTTDKPDTKPTVAGPVHQVPSPRDPKVDQSRTSGPHSINNAPPPVDKPVAHVPEHQHDLPSERKLPWKGPLTAPNSYAPWSGAKIGAPSVAGNLWGPPNNDKALGNGTFDRNLTGFPSRDLSSHGPLSLTEPPPIGPPQLSTEKPTHHQLRTAPKQIPDGGPALSPLASPEQRPGRLAGAENISPIARPGPIGPPVGYPPGQRWQQNQFPRRSEETAAWNNFHLVARKVDVEENERFHRELQAKREEEARTGIKPTLQVTFNETWRHVKAGDEAGQRHVVSVNKSPEKATPLSPLHGFETPADGLPFSDIQSKSVTTVRGSRFFPQGSDQMKRSLDRDTVEDRSPSPPPPEEISSHPVFTTGSPRPLVHLPGPKPRVRLPPRSSPPPPPPATFASMVASSPPAPPPRGTQPIASTATWQDRFNGLFGRKPLPQTLPSPQGRKSVLAVTSASKEPLEVVPDTPSAAVSLPHINDVNVDPDAGKTTSKEVEDEEAIFEDREAGSLPVVKVPHMAPKAAWRPALPPSQQRLRSRFQRPIQVQSIEPYVFSAVDKGNNTTVSVIIHLPGTDCSKTHMIPAKGGPSGGSAQARPRPQNFKHRRGAKSRENSGVYHTSQSLKKNPTAGNANPIPGARPHSGHANWASRVAGATV